MIGWTFNEPNGSGRLTLPSVGFLALVQREGFDWRATLFRPGVRQESPLFTWRDDAQAYAEEWMREKLDRAKKELPKRRKQR